MFTLWIRSHRIHPHRQMIRNTPGRFQVLAVADEIDRIGFEQGDLFFGEIDVVDRVVEVALVAGAFEGGFLVSKCGAVALFVESLKGVGGFGGVEIACNDDHIAGVEAGQARQQADLFFGIFVVPARVEIGQENGLSIDAEAPHEGLAVYRFGQVLFEPGPSDQLHAGGFPEESIALGLVGRTGGGVGNAVVPPRTGAVELVGQARYGLRAAGSGHDFLEGDEVGVAEYLRDLPDLGVGFGLAKVADVPENTCV